MEDTLVDRVTELLRDLTRRRTSAIRISRNTALLSRHVLRVGCPPQGYAECTRRRGAKELGLSVSEFRTALDTLLLWGWIERQPSVPNTSGHYRLTGQFVEVVRRDDVALYHAIRDRLPAVFNEEQDSYKGEKANETIGDSHVRHALQALTLAQLMHRIFELNRIQREHYRRAYNKGTLRNVCTVLYWLLQEVDSGKLALISLRCLCKQTGLVFNTGKRARAQLVAWGLLAQEGGVYHLDHQRLADILEGEDAGLPPPPLRAPPLQAPRTFTTHRTVVTGFDETTGACLILPEQKAP